MTVPLNALTFPIWQYLMCTPKAGQYSAHGICKTSPVTQSDPAWFGFIVHACSRSTHTAEYDTPHRKSPDSTLWLQTHAACCCFFMFVCVRSVMPHVASQSWHNFDPTSPIALCSHAVSNGREILRTLRCLVLIWLREVTRILWWFYWCAMLSSHKYLWLRWLGFSLVFLLSKPMFYGLFWSCRLFWLLGLPHHTSKMLSTQSWSYE